VCREAWSASVACWGYTVLVESMLVMVGLAVLTVAANHLVLGSSRLAARLRVSPVVVGVVVIGLGTSAPEFLVSGVAAARGDTGIAVGNIVGSNILNVTLILGVAALVASVGVSSTVIRREVRLAVVAVAVFAIVAWLGLSFWTGALLLAGTAAALWLLLRWARQGRNQDVASEALEFAETPAVVDVPVAPARLPTVVEPVRAMLGLAGVLVGAQLMVANASTIANELGVPQLIIGLTLVALGTSLPELVTTVVAQRRGESELVVGNLFGSNLFNSLAGGAVIGFASRADATVRPAVALLGVMVLTVVIAWALLRRGLRLTRPEGAVLLGCYVVSLPIVLAG
jgi:cation:H+ antiporter